MEMSAIKMAMEIRETVMILSYPVIVFATVLMFYRGQFQDHGKAILNIIFIAIIIGCIRIYPPTVLAATDYIHDASGNVAAQIEKGMDNWSKSQIEGQDSTFNVSAKITAVLYKGTIALSSIIRSFLVFMQRVALYVLIALSPLLLALFLINETSSVAVKFTMTTFAIILWGIGFNLSDMMIYSGWDAILHTAINSPGTLAALGGGTMGSALISSASISTALPVLTISLALMICFYFLVAVLFFNTLGILLIMSLLHGGDPISSAMQSLNASSNIANGTVNSVRAGKAAGTAGVGYLKNSLSKGKGAVSGVLSKIGKGNSNV